MKGCEKALLDNKTARKCDKGKKLKGGRSGDYLWGKNVLKKKNTLVSGGSES